MLTRKELLQRTGISGATLNQYIALGIVPEPVTEAPAAGRDHQVVRIETVRRLREEGLSMAEIAAIFRKAPEPQGLPESQSPEDQPSRGALENEHPQFTPICALVADLQDSERIRAELPPQEYFELINHIWRMGESVVREYPATQGKHPGDGMVLYFVPQPGRSYVLDAVLCAKELQLNMRRIGKDWQLHKNWTNELYLNIGLSEGGEWFGAYHSAGNVEFTVLGGDTVEHARWLSGFARCGAVWVTKNLIGKLSPDERKMFRLGIRRINDDGREILDPASYSRFSDLAEFDSMEREALPDVAALAVTEVLEVARAEVLLRPDGQICPVEYGPPQWDGLIESGNSNFSLSEPDISA